MGMLPSGLIGTDTPPINPMPIDFVRPCVGVNGGTEPRRSNETGEDGGQAMATKPMDDRVRIGLLVIVRVRVYGDRME